MSVWLLSICLYQLIERTGRQTNKDVYILHYYIFKQVVLDSSMADWLEHIPCQKSG